MPGPFAHLLTAYAPVLVLFIYYNNNNRFLPYESRKVPDGGLQHVKTALKITIS